MARRILFLVVGRIDGVLIAVIVVVVVLGPLSLLGLVLVLVLGLVLGLVLLPRVVHVFLSWGLLMKMLLLLLLGVCCRGQVTYAVHSVHKVQGLQPGALSPGLDFGLGRPTPLLPRGREVGQLLVQQPGLAVRAARDGSKERTRGSAAAAADDTSTSAAAAAAAAAPALAAGRVHPGLEHCDAGLRISERDVGL